ncbi:peroxisomal biogenesis factor 3-like isoform X1 [Dreissena polymorpha]|uniref:peroxisomal biogenesis factor 3-like isoform X1 n=1 Tax=Dreissena polymorpha TaxID=45954 RepID=UPI002263D1AB|nr:peroxisomal biogenesis factor 3-like isoform X1 [Dreissena polymorpha]
MFRKIWNFIKRHKKKLIVTAVLLYGSRYVYRYISRQLKEFQDKEAAECLEQARRQHHFDSNQRTCNMTVLSLLPTLRDKLRELLNTEKISDELKSNPSNKLELWEDLKMCSFTRMITVVYACSLMCMMLRVQLNIIGGYMYADNVRQHKGLVGSWTKANTMIQVAPTEVQERYIGLVRVFFDKGLEKLMLRVKDAVTKETQSVSLKEKLTLQNLEAMVKHVRARVENGHELGVHHPATLPLTQHLVCWNAVKQSSIEDGTYGKLLKETEDILESADFHCVLSLGLDRGFAKVQDYLAELFKSHHKTETSIVHLHEVTIPMAKLIPFVSSLLMKLGSDAPNPLVQELLLMEQSKTLAANIYEAFSSTDDVEDSQFSP